MYWKGIYWKIGQKAFEKYSTTTMSNRETNILPVCCQTGPPIGLCLMVLNFLARVLWNLTNQVYLEIFKKSTKSSRNCQSRQPDPLE